MKLEDVEIKNFRSVKLQRIRFAPQCLGLVGINESGKSNVLKALSLLSPANKPSPGDVREIPDPEEFEQRKYVRFFFTLDNKDIKQIAEIFDDDVLSFSEEFSFYKHGKKLELVDVIKAISNRGFYEVDLEENKRSVSLLPYSSWEAGHKNTITFKPIWKAVSGNCPPEQKIATKSGDELAVSEFSIINVEEFNDVPKQFVEEFSKEQIYEQISNFVEDFIQENLPEVIFWEYKEEYLLPPAIALADFSQNPAKHPPLKCIFELSGIQDITSEIEKFKKRPNGLENLFTRVSDSVTKHLNNVWKDIDVQILIEDKSPNISINVKDKKFRYQFDRRSDGFKRLVTFLILISARVRTGQLENALILVDEPDTSLHIQGTKYILSELIKISENNLVVFSTHSIFMVDRENPARHLIVKKEREITTIAKVTNSNFRDEDVIYQALGGSTFEFLEKKNLLFEGWRDKNLFKKALESNRNDLKAAKKKLKRVGISHAQGVKDFKNITPLLEMGNRNCVILSDDDQISREQQKKFQENKYYGKWLRYSEVFTTNAETAEDFIKPRKIVAAFDNLRRNDESIAPLGEEEFSISSGKLKFIKSKLISSGKTNAQAKSILNELKEEIFTSLTISDIEEEYFVFVRAVSDLDI